MVESLAEVTWQLDAVKRFEKDVVMTIQGNHVLSKSRETMPATMEEIEEAEFTRNHY